MFKLYIFSILFCFGLIEGHEVSTKKEMPFDIKVSCLFTAPVCSGMIISIPIFKKRKS